MLNETWPAAPPAPNTRAAGAGVAAAAVLSLVFVALDQNATGDSPLAVLQSINQIRPIHQIVHLVAIASTSAFAFGFISLASRLGLRRPAVLAGLVAYLIGCVAMIGATLMDGFISTDLAAAFAKAASPESVKTGYNIVVAVGVALTDLARLGWIFQAIGTLAWSMLLVQDRGFNRRIGAIGLLSGCLVAFAAATSGPNMPLHAILGILLAQLTWNLAAAVFLFRRAGAPDPARA